MTKAIRVRDLPERPRYGVQLLCVECGETYSATRGDYFMANPQTVMTCCDEPLTLVRREVHLIPVSLLSAEGR